MRSLAILTLFPVFLSFVNCQCEPPSYTAPEQGKLQVIRSDCTAGRDCTADETPWDYFRVNWAGISGITDDWELMILYSRSDTLQAPKYMHESFGGDILKAAASKKYLDVMVYYQGGKAYAKHQGKDTELDGPPSQWAFLVQSPTEVHDAVYIDTTLDCNM